ncbi:MAG: hypothetical protein M1816_002695 [Peltula sp. TS41687]|nr:MAG: hypothetical protein M1816_002695 [Peltula sp. TS41687]
MQSFDDKSQPTQASTHYSGDGFQSQRNDGRHISSCANPSFDDPLSQPSAGYHPHASTWGPHAANDAGQSSAGGTNAPGPLPLTNENLTTHDHHQAHRWAHRVDDEEFYYQRRVAKVKDVMRSLGVGVSDDLARRMTNHHGEMVPMERFISERDEKYKEKEQNIREGSNMHSNLNHGFDEAEG